jgi:hypothetical protein
VGWQGARKLYKENNRIDQETWLETSAGVPAKPDLLPPISLKKLNWLKT